MNQSRRHEMAPTLVLVIFLLITALATWYVWVSSHAAERARFEVASQRTEDAIESRTETYLNVLRAASGLFAAAQDVTRDQFRAYVRSLDVQGRYPGMQGIGISVRVPEGRMDEVINDLRLNDSADFHIWPPGPREEYHTIVVLEPVDRRNQAAIGYDMFTNPKRRAAMIRARDTGEPAATTGVRLVQEIDSDKQNGFLIYVPVYVTPTTPETVEERRASLYGFVYAAFRANDLFAGIFTDAKSEVAFALEVDGVRLFESPGFAAAGDRNVYRRTGQMRVAGVDWTVLFASQGEARSESVRLAAAVAASGALISALLFALLRAQLAARANAERVAETLHQASRAKDEFLATLSHELRTPMTAILGWAKLLGEDIDDETKIIAIDSIKKSSAAQAQLIEDLLDVSRITAGKMRIDRKPIELGPVVTAAAEAIRPMADAKRIALEVDVTSTPMRVAGDAHRLQQIVWNLLSNAVKFTPSGGSVTLTARKLDGEAEITVADSGQGIEPEFLPFVFDRFRQADSSTTRAYTGLGLGLAIVKHLVDLHGGKVSAESDGKSRGSRFIAKLPLLGGEANVPEPGDREDRESLDALRGAKILVVDDESEVREYAGAAFRLGGADVQTADSVASALEVLAKWAPDVIVTDIGMPERDGFDLLRAVRADGNVPVVALTAYARPEDAQRAEEAGFAAFIAKPVDPAELRAAVGRVVGGRGL